MEKEPLGERFLFLIFDWPRRWRCEPGRGVWRPREAYALLSSDPGAPPARAPSGSDSSYSGSACCLPPYLLRICRSRGMLCKNRFFRHFRSFLQLLFLPHKKEDIILIIAYFPLFLQDLTFSCSFCPCWCILFLQFTHAFLEADLCSHKNLLPEMHEGSTTPCAKMSCEAAESSVFANGAVNCNMLCVDELMPTAAKG